jgi:hypothetical protein
MKAQHPTRTPSGRPLAGIVLAYLLGCGIALPWHLYRVAPDTVSYLTIARKYRAWDFSDAINGYWSPLFSWLLAPLLCLGGPTDVTAKCLTIAIGAGGLASVWWLARRMELPTEVCIWTTLCVVPAVAMYSLTDTTPDLLVAVILVVYLGVVIGTDYPRSIWQGAACGLLGALAYLAKAYALPFFLAHYLAVSGYLLLRRRSDGGELRRLAAATATGLLVFAVVAGSWAGLLSRKYSRITIGTTGSYQFSLFKGGGGGLFRGGGLFPPSNATAISAWEDPTDLRTPDNVVRRKKELKPAARQAGRSPAKAEDAPRPRPVGATTPATGAPSPGVLYRCREALAHFSHNLVRLLWTLVRFVWVSPLVLLGLLLSFRFVPPGAARDRCVILLGTLLLYPSGYLLIFIQERYFWLMTFLLAVAAGLLVTTLPILRRGPWSKVWPVVAVISFSLWPAYILVRLWDHVLEVTPAVAAQLKPEIPPGARIASDLEWGITNSIAYYLDARYYGMLPGASTEEQERQLREHKIAYLAVWGDPKRFPIIDLARELPVKLPGNGRYGYALRVFALPPFEPKPGQTPEQDPRPGVDGRADRR